jgi:hypothetical protein
MPPDLVAAGSPSELDPIDGDETRAGPSVVIELSLEEKPKVYVSAETLGGEERLADWLASQTELSELVERALDLEKRSAREAQRPN